jgi:signal peptidase I
VVRTVGFHPTNLGSIPSSGTYLICPSKKMYEEKQNKKNAFETLSEIFSSITQFVFNTLEAVVIALALSIIFYLFVATPHEVVGRSMMPNFQTGEYLIGNKIGYKFTEPKRGDVIIFQYDEHTDYIKRIIGLPEENVSIQNGHLYINDQRLDESEYLESSVSTRGGDFLQEGKSINIPEHNYFVCGDNRGNSSDSRDFGFIDRDQIKGRAFLVYFPFSNLRLIKDTTIDLHTN